MRILIHEAEEKVSVTVLGQCDIYSTTALTDLVLTRSEAMLQIIERVRFRALSSSPKDEFR
jgi:hypothetical protein